MFFYNNIIYNFFINKNIPFALVSRFTPVSLILDSRGYISWLVVGMRGSD